MGFGLPQHPAVVGPQGGRAVPQRLVELEPALALRPGLEQGIGGRQRHLLQVGLRQPGPYRGLHAGVQLDRAHRAGRIDGDQAHRGQVVDRGAHHILIRAARRARPPGDVAAGGGAGQDRAGHPVVVQHGGQHQGGPGQAGRRQVVGALGREGPGGQDGGRHTVQIGHVLAALGQRHPVLAAALLAGVDHRGGLGQPERQAAEVLAEVERLDALVGMVGEPGAEVGQRLSPAQPRHRDDRDVPALELRGRQPGGDQDPAGRAGRPQAFQVGQVGQVIDDQRPRAFGVGQPGDETCGGRLGSLAGMAGIHRVGRLREAGEDRLGVGRGHPDQDLDQPAVPHGVGELDRQLGLARTALAGRRDLGLLAVHQHRGLSWMQAGGQVRAGFGARVIGVSQRRHNPGQQDPRLRRRSGLLSDHVRQPLLPAPQSALAGLGVPGRTCRATRHISHDNKDHRGAVIYRDKSNYGVIASNRAYPGTACRSSCWPSLAISGRPQGRNGSNGMLMTDTRPPGYAPDSLS